VIERLNSRGDWSAPARFNHGFDSGPGTGEYCLDGSVLTITHPTMQPAPVRFVLDKCAIADALHQAAHDNVANDVNGHASSPASMTRVPVQRDVDQRSIDRI
jgi:hypothetical protein